MDFAQTVTSVDLPSLWGEIARTGLVGVLFIIVCYALIRRDKDLTEERRLRIDDAKATAALVRDQTAAMTAWTASQEDRNRALEAMAKALEAIRNGK